MNVLVDSDILIDVTRGRDNEVVGKWMELGRSSDSVLYSVVSVAELWHGAKPREYALLDDLFKGILCVPVDHHIAFKAGEFLRTFSGSHHLELGDALIAASVFATGSLLWTRNKKHNPMSVSFF